MCNSGHRSLGKDSSIEEDDHNPKLQSQENILEPVRILPTRMKQQSNESRDIIMMRETVDIEDLNLTEKKLTLSKTDNKHVYLHRNSLGTSNRGDTNEQTSKFNILP